MFARMFTIEGRREQLDEFAFAGENVLPALKRLDGFEGLLILANRQNGKILIVTLWQSEEAMRSGEEASYWFRAFSAEAAGGEVPNVERYEVVFSKKREARHQPGFGIFTLQIGGGWWFYWPLIGWGIGLGVHALAVFGFSGGGPWGRDWEERKTREFMDQDRRRQPAYLPKLVEGTFYDVHLTRVVRQPAVFRRSHNVCACQHCDRDHCVVPRPASSRSRRRPRGADSDPQSPLSSPPHR